MTSHSATLAVADIASLSTGRNELSRIFFHSIVHLPPLSLHSLFPPSPDPDLLARLRAPTKFPCIPTRTKRYQSSLSYALSRYQTQILSTPLLLGNILHPQ